MDQAEAEGLIRSGVRVTRQQVTIAKSAVIRATRGGSPAATLHLLDVVVRDAGITIPAQLVLHPSADPATAVKAIAGGFSWKLAAIEAIWALAGSGALIVSGTQVFTPSIGYTTVPPSGGGGHSGGLTLNELSFPFPSDVRRAPSLAESKDLYLSDPDLYLGLALGISSMHAEISDALREAVKCFRADLFTAAGAMLGKASEGAWLELGDSLLAAAPAHQDTTFKNQKAILENPRDGTAKKIEAVLTIYSKQDVFAALQDKTGISPKELKDAALWSETLRDARNTLHFLHAPATPNTYDKVAVLLLSAAQPLRTLYKLRDAAIAHAPTPSGTP
jgi:hypothetical protein